MSGLFDSTSWYDESVPYGEIGSVPMTDAAAGASNFYQDLVDSIGLTFDGDVPIWISNDEDFTKALELFKSSGVDTTIKTPQTVEVSKPTADKGGPGILDRIGGFVEKNKGLTEILARGVAAAAGGGTQAKQAAQIVAKSRLDELKLKNELDQQNNARVSASVTGLQTPSARMPGIIELAKRKQAAMSNVYTGKP